MLFHTTSAEMQETIAFAETKILAPVTSRFEDRICKKRAIMTKATHLSMAN